ncbi:MAG: N-formylglutamate amidohydrolase [Mesorhizobium sp.]|nr:N-formylglutamate amidohydrolase [Mesorhizobium sp.]MBL8579141.1 N-formylglutamate amidohydrolase [Mesorhizobium sp.]
MQAGQATGAGSGVEGKGVVRVTNRTGTSPYVLVCDHASNWLPEEYGTLGLTETDMLRHIAWDPGALPVALKMAGMLDAPLVESGVSRLAVDCNRPLDAPDLIPQISETTLIPGNATLSAKGRAERIALSWQPFHQAIENLIEERVSAGRETRLVSIHSFNPVYRDVPRPWEIGILHDDDDRLSAPLIAALEAQARFTVGDNQPYSPADRVYFTLERHARSRGLPCAMIEIRNDEIADHAGQHRWAELLAGIFQDLNPAGGTKMADVRMAGR